MLILRKNLASQPALIGVRLLQAAACTLFIVSGIDKFLHYLANWDGYVVFFLPLLTGLESEALLRAVGVGEIFLGVGLWVRPRLWAPYASLWLLGVVLNSLLRGKHWDIAAIDFLLATAVFALGAASPLLSSRIKPRPFDITDSWTPRAAA